MDSGIKCYVQTLGDSPSDALDKMYKSRRLMKHIKET